MANRVFIKLTSTQIFLLNISFHLFGQFSSWPVFCQFLERILFKNKNIKKYNANMVQSLEKLQDLINLLR